MNREDKLYDEMVKLENKINHLEREKAKLIEDLAENHRCCKGCIDGTLDRCGNCSVIDNIKGWVNK